MKRLRYLLLALAGFAAVMLGWRWLSRKRRLPCPSQLSWLVSGPLSDFMEGTAATLDHIGLQPGERGLDVGSGPGRLAVPAAQRVGPAGSILAFDLQPAMLEKLRTRAERVGVANITARLGDITTDDSLPSESFDRAWLVTVLGEVPDQAAALRNIYRALKAEGQLTITEVLPDPHYQRRQTVLRLGQAAGFQPTGYWRHGLMYTQNFVKPQTLRE